MLGAGVPGAGRELTGSPNGTFYQFFPVAPFLGTQAQIHALADQVGDGSAGCLGELPKRLLLIFGQLNLSAHHAIMIAVFYSMM